jgi:hypothetical protein
MNTILALDAVREGLKIVDFSPLFGCSIILLIGAWGLLLLCHDEISCILASFTIIPYFLFSPWLIKIAALLLLLKLISHQSKR